MKTTIVLAGVLLGFIGMIVSTNAYAEEIQGQVDGINLTVGSLMIARSDPATVATEAESIQVFVTAETVYDGIAGLEELRVGDEVWANVTKHPGDDKWYAGSIKLDKVQIREPQTPETP